MKMITDSSVLRHELALARQQKKKIGFVPTMGNLHAGHRQLLVQALADCSFVVASIFVNSLQFGPNEDLVNYPRTFEADQSLLAELSCHVLFYPSVETMYPLEKDQQTLVHVPVVTQGLCGHSRPDHFSGVATVVTKLFNIVQPDRAYFGQKDFQQWLVVRKLVADLNMPIEIVGVPTVRAKDGLALSSRNQYLSQTERTIAPKLYEVLQIAAERLKKQPDTTADISAWINQMLKEMGFKPDYVEIRDANTLSANLQSSNQWVLLVAAYLGRTRLIDNLVLTLNHAYV